MAVLRNRQMKAFADRIHEMSRVLRRKREEIAGLDGEKRQVLEALKTYGCTDIESAKALLAKTDKEIAKTSEELRELLDRLEKDFDWS